MPAKKHRPEEVIGKLREAELVLAQGATTAVFQSDRRGPIMRSHGSVMRH